MTTAAQPTPNVELLRRTLAHIEEPSTPWDQEDYRCETGMCFAGWAAQLAGGVWVTGPDDPWSDTLVADATDDPAFLHDVHGTEGISAARRAARILGLTPEQSYRLFAGGNDLETLRHIVDELCESERS